MRINDMGIFDPLTPDQVRELNIGVERFARHHGREVIPLTERPEHTGRLFDLLNDGPPVVDELPVRKIQVDVALTISVRELPRLT